MQDLPDRARRSIRTLLVRQLVLQVLNLCGGIVVARRLGPGPLGLFGIAVFVTTVANLVTDLGLKTALIRRAAPVAERELVTSFTLRQLLVTPMVALLFVGAPMIAALYPHVPSDLVWLLRLLAFDLYLLSWRATSEVLLERDLRFEHLATADVIGTIVYQLVSIGLVFTGWGAQSLVWGVLASSLLRTILLYRAAPWPVRLALDPPTIRESLRVGIAVQASQVLSQLPAWVTPTLVAAAIGPEAVGLLNWASWIARKPLEVLENVVRVSLAHFAHLQRDPDAVERLLVRYVTAALLVCGLWFAVLCVAGFDLVAFVYTDRWVPAVPALLVYAAAAWVAAFRWITTTALVGLGRLRFTVQVTTVASMVAVLASLQLVLWVGALGVPCGQLIEMLVSAPWLLRGFHAETPVHVLRRLRWVLAPMAAALAAGLVVAHLPSAPPVRGLLTASIATAVYGSVVWWMGPAWLWSALPTSTARRGRE